MRSIGLFFCLALFTNSLNAAIVIKDTLVTSVTSSVDTLSPVDSSAIFSELLDSLRTNKKGEKKERADTSLMKIKPQKSPKIAGLLSAALPGAGQVYNRGWKAWWKVGIIYGGGYLLYKYIVLNQKRERFFHDILILRDLDSSDTHIADFVDAYPDVEDYTVLTGAQFAAVDEARVELEYDSYRSRLQNLYVFSVVLYGLNILDAVVDAHLKQFDVSDDLALKIKPSVLNMNGHYSGLGPAISFKFSLK